MIDSGKNQRPTARNESEEEILHEMSRDMDVALYRPYGEADAAKILGISTSELGELRNQGNIAFLYVTGKHISFFGHHLLLYLLDCVVPVGAVQEMEPKGKAKPAPKPNQPEAELISVHDTMVLLGIGRTKLYELMGAKEIETVKIGRRTLIRRASLGRFTGSPN